MCGGKLLGYRAVGVEEETKGEFISVYGVLFYVLRMNFTQGSVQMIDTTIIVLIVQL